MHSETIISKFIHTLSPSFRYRWEIYDDLLSTYLSKERIWFDIGCGNNGHVSMYPEAVKLAVGVDVVCSRCCHVPFIQADLRKLPLRSNCADLVTLRFVVEHLVDIPRDLSDVIRVLKPNGHLIVFTTNLYSPFVFLPKLLPFSIKSLLIRLIFKVESIDIFRTYHQFNSPFKFRKVLGACELEKLMYIDNISTMNVLIFVVSGIWYLITRIRPMDLMRSNLLAVYRKKE